MPDQRRQLQQREQLLFPTKRPYYVHECKTATSIKNVPPCSRHTLGAIESRTHSHRWSYAGAIWLSFPSKLEIVERDEKGQAGMHAAAPPNGLTTEQLTMYCDLLLRCYVTAQNLWSTATLARILFFLSNHVICFARNILIAS